MAAKVLSRRWLRAIIPAGLVIFAAASFYFHNSTSPRSSSIPAPAVQKVTAPKIEKVRPGLPVRLKIPRIAVDAAVESMGLDSNGAMDAPKGPANVGWYMLGQRPGESGSAVITGHFGWKDGLSSVFDNLHTLHTGDKLSITDEKGVTVGFVVRELRKYSQHDDTKSVFSSSDGKAHLNLITCQGTWNKNSRSYSERLVVFADQE
jgi:LPXTG-site transpeptidase (sortase) family protein